MMRDAIRRCSALVAAIAWVSFPACSTQEISAPPVSYVGVAPGPDVGALLIVFAPTADTYEEQLAIAPANPPSIYGVFMDGRQLVDYDVVTGHPDPILAYEGAQTGAGFLAAGVGHHFEVVQAGGGPTIFAGDAVLPPDSTTRLYLYGHLDALQGKFVSYPSVPAPNTLHVSVTNLVHRGPGIEVVSCVSDADCTPQSPALAFGETFDGDFAPGALNAGPVHHLADNATLGFRQVPTAGLPAPPMQPLSAGEAAPDPRQSSLGMSANLVAAPYYLSATGQVLWWAN